MLDVLNKNYLSIIYNIRSKNKQRGNYNIFSILQNFQIYHHCYYIRKYLHYLK
jgi:hypothetical protein